MSIGFLYCLKGEQDISIKPILSGVKKAFRCTPALSIAESLSKKSHLSGLTFAMYLSLIVVVINTSNVVSS